MTNPPTPKNTSAFYVQAAVSFGLAVVGVIGGEVYLPIDGWPRAFLVLGTIFLVTSSFTLAKVIRDAQEGGSVVNRLDQARLERLLAEFDPYKVPDFPPTHGPVGPPYTPYPAPTMAPPAQPQAA